MSLINHDNFRGSPGLDFLSFVWRVACQEVVGKWIMVIESKISPPERKHFHINGAFSQEISDFQLALTGSQKYCNTLVMVESGFWQFLNFIVSINQILKLWSEPKQTGEKLQVALADILLKMQLFWGYFETNKTKVLIVQLGKTFGLTKVPITETEENLV